MVTRSQGNKPGSSKTCLFFTSPLARLLCCQQFLLRLRPKAAPTMSEWAGFMPSA